jgi:NAD-dependent deacetylase sirtuin 4
MSRKLFCRPLVLTGAGVSTESGVPDYRGPNGVYQRNPSFKPITYQQFMSSSYFRKRYWMRSYLGYPMIHRAQPNSTHLVLSQMESNGLIQSLITQNVDGLHSKAGSKNVLELHGSLHVVKCTQCHTEVDRDSMQTLLSQMNPDMQEIGIPTLDVSSSTNPDGDAHFERDIEFQVPSCHNCGSILKPNVVFFGENMQANVRDAAFEQVEAASSLWVFGSSLTVYSALRLVKQARERQIPIVIVNLGPTRGDDLANLIISQPSSLVLKELIGADKGAFVSRV